MRRVWALAGATGLVAGSGTVSDWRRGKEDTVDRRIALASELIKKHMVVHGIPGLAVGLTVNGKKIFTQGFGYACLETGAPCTENTIMRIASISKPITATIAARLVGEGKLDLNKPIEEYLPDFPKKSFNNNPVQITTRQLLCHTGGIRHYAKKTEEADLEDNANNTSTKEFLSNKNYATVCDALKMFQDDDLLDSPGNSFNYTTHGLTLVSAVLEKAAGKDFPKLVRELCMKYELRNTYLDVNKRIIPYRAKYYVRTQEGVLNNCQEVDNSYKWAGGGLLSNVGDLLSLANFYLKSFHSLDEGFLQKGVLDDFWKGEIQTSADSTTKAALGWMRVDGLDGQEKTSSTLWYHTGAAVGASSILLIRPTPQKDPTVPSGLCLTMICNLQDTSLYSLANDIEALFHDYRSEPVIN